MRRRFSARMASMSSANTGHSMGGMTRLDALVERRGAVEQCSCGHGGLLRCMLYMSISAAYARGEHKDVKHTPAPREGHAPRALN